MWENTLEKLKILNYEQNFCGNGKHQPLSRIHFVVPAKNQSSQFDDFIDLCSWLCTVITKNTETFRRDQYDDPNTITNKLLLALRQLDFKGSFPSQKLRTPHGESACMVMEFLVDKALDTKGFKFATPVYLDIAEVSLIDQILPVMLSNIDAVRTIDSAHIRRLPFEFYSLSIDYI